MGNVIQRVRVVFKLTFDNGFIDRPFGTGSTSYARRDGPILDTAARGW